MSPTATGSARPSLWQRYVLTPVLAQLRQGVSPDKIALTLALGVVVGVFPILGASTALCVVAGLWLRLNQPILQLVNYLVYPLQLALLLPFYRAGERLFGSDPVPLFSATELVERFRAGPAQFFADYGMVGLYGIAVWLLAAPICAAVLYLALRRLLPRPAAVRVQS